MKISFIMTLIIVSFILGCSRGGMPMGYCDPFGPGPLYIFKEKGGKCTFGVKIECNVKGSVENNCLKYSNAERKLALEEYIAKMDKKDYDYSYLYNFKNKDICIECNNSSTCPILLMRELLEKVC